MRKPSSIVLLLFAFVFLAAAAAYAVAGTFANEAYDKVVPPDWCVEHGYIALWNPDDPYVCIRCD